jgi:hypothetical protein
MMPQRRKPKMPQRSSDVPKGFTKIQLNRGFDDEKELAGWMSAFYPGGSVVRTWKREILIAEIIVPDKTL